jgi:hypothetical protein
LRRNKRSLHVDANPKIAIQWRIFRPMNKFINIAISPDNKEKLEYFYFHRRHAVLNTFDKNLAEHWRKSGYTPKKKNVKALSIDKLMDKFINSICSKIDLVMTDIEGNDFDVIKKIVDYCVNNENPRIVLPTFILCEDKNGEIEEFLVNQLKNYLLLGSKHQSKMFKLNHIE